MTRVGTRGRLWLLAAAVAILCLVVLLGRGAESQGAAPPPNVLRVAFSSFPDYLDPQLSFSSEGWTAMYETYIPLLTYQRASGKAGAEVIPGLARELPEVSNGGRTYTLFLRHGLRYSDGSPVRASDFEHAVKRLFEMHSSGAPFYTVIAGAGKFARTARGDIGGIVTDNRSGRITVHLRRPSGSLPQLLALPFAAPVPADTPMRDQTFSPPPATGPYVFAEVDAGWAYDRNPVWAGGNGEAMPQLPDGFADRIEVRVIRGTGAQLGQLGQRKLDWIAGYLDGKRFAKFRRRHATQVRMEPILSTYYFWMNTRKAPFSDPRVREAANYAVNRRALTRIHGGYLVPSQQILPPGMPGYARFTPYPFDLAKARRLVAAADPPDRRVTVWADTEAHHADAAAYYARQLRKIGLRARLKAVGAFSYLSALSKPSTPNFDTGWANWFADYSHPDDFFQPLLHGSGISRFGSGNFAQVSVPRLNARIEQLGRGPLTPGTERGYAALDRAYMKVAPWVPFGNSTLPLVVSKRVDLDGVVWNPLFGADLASFRFG